MWNCKSFYQVVCFIQLSEAGVLSVFLKMDKIEYRAFIKFFVKDGLTPKEKTGAYPKMDCCLLFTAHHDIICCIVPLTESKVK